MNQCTPVITQVLDIYKTYLFHQIKVGGGSKQLDEYNERYMIPFLKHMFDIIITIGWCPYVIQKDQDQNPYPDIVPPDHFDTFLIYNTQTLKHRFLFKMYDKVLRRIKHVQVSPWQQLVQTGIIGSPSLKLLHEYRYCEQLRKFQLQADFTRSNPTIFLQPSKASQKDDATKHHDVPKSVGFADRIKNRGLKSQIEKAATDSGENQQFHEEQMQKMFYTHRQNYFNKGQGYVPQTLNNLFVCPPGMELAVTNNLSPSISVDLPMLERLFNANVFKVYNIPGTLFDTGDVTGKSSQGKGSELRVAMDIGHFLQQLTIYGKMFREIYATVYKDIFGKEIDIHKISFNPPSMLKEIIQQTRNDKQVPPTKTSSKSTAKPTPKKTN